MGFPSARTDINTVQYEGSQQSTVQSVSAAQTLRRVQCTTYWRNHPRFLSV